ncbi:MAG: AzlD domain-containing protein [Spirochaetales bacterium]|nr:AzlD domain-containing protein [Spirochaetales bacterium]
MVRVDWLVVVVGLTIGTYLIRALPFWFSRIERLPAPLRRFLEFVPAAALGALIIPDAFIGSPGAIAALSIVSAFALSLRGFNLTVVVLVSILLAWVGLSLTP